MESNEEKEPPEKTTAQQGDGDLGIPGRVFQDFHFWQAAVGDRQPGPAISNAGEGPLRDLGPGLFDPGLVEGGNTDLALDNFEVPIVGAGFCSEGRREVDAQTMVAGTVVYC